MSPLALVAVNAVVVLACMLVLWLTSIRLGDVSFIDSFWALGFVIIAAVSFGLADGDGARRALILGVTAIWGLRLSIYLFWRWRRQGPDARYVAMLRRAATPHTFSLTRIFLLQGVLMWIVSLPVQLGQAYDDPSGLQPQTVIGLVLAAVGFLFESVGDAQLTRFKADPANAGHVMDRGLWRYTRHPNYFGDCCVWWGLFLIAVVNVETAIAVIGPIVMTMLLLKYSGAALLERRLKRHRPEYEDYIRRTSGFIPLPPRTGGVP